MAVDIAEIMGTFDGLIATSPVRKAHLRAAKKAKNTGATPRRVAPHLKKAPVKASGRTQHLRGTYVEDHLQTQLYSRLEYEDYTCGGRVWEDGGIPGMDSPQFSPDSEGIDSKKGDYYESRRAGHGPEGGEWNAWKHAHIQDVR